MRNRISLHQTNIKTLLLLAMLCSFSGFFSPLKAAEGIQATTLHDGKVLVLNGIGKVEQLSESFYIGALYLEEPFRSVDNITYMNSYKRMQLRIVNKRVSARHFAQYWKESISINSPRNIWEPQVKDVLTFASLFKKTLITGDIVNLDYIPDMGTYVNVNGVILGRIRNPGFHNLLMMAWLGNRPPSEQFKLGVMGGNDTDTAVKLQQEFKLLGPSEDRIKVTNSWFEDATVEKKKVVVNKPKSKPKPKPKPKPKVTNKKVESNKAKSNNNTKGVKATKVTTKAPAIKLVSTTTNKAVIKAKPKTVVKKKPEPKQLTSSEKLKLYAARSSYERELRKKIHKYQMYPISRMLRNRSYKKQMKRGPIESNGVLWVKIDRNGSILSSKLEQSTGIPILDKSALKMVEKANPLPKMPAILVGDDFEFFVQLKFISPEMD